MKTLAKHSIYEEIPMDTVQVCLRIFAGRTKMNNHHSSSVKRSHF